MMNVLIVGSGGREHALAWKVAQSLRLTKLYIAPGNAGTATCGENVLLDVNRHADVIRFCEGHQINLVLVGPEVSLANGLVDALSDAGIRCFGPRQAAAEIEASKVFAKDFMARHHIPTARYATFSQLDEAIHYLESVDYLVVIKASGLAAGKGVILPETMAEAKSTLEGILIDKAFGVAGNEVVIEERLSGQEVSLMAFTDGTTIVPMLPAQDHKRLLDGDEGPNTGGMGAYAPAPVFTEELLQEAIKKVLQPAVDGLRNEGRMFVGVLYAGLMLTKDGIRVLEFNCRLGDPETQVILPRMKNDFLELILAATEERLSGITMQWVDEDCVCVVIASQGYPEEYEVGKKIAGLSTAKKNPSIQIFHAGT